MFIDGKSLDLAGVLKVSKDFEPVNLSPLTFKKIDRSSEFINIKFGVQKFSYLVKRLVVRVQKSTFRVLHRKKVLKVSMKGVFNPNKAFFSLKN